jgi:pimeloyl-ACP methyl ester carboxylesterase
MESRIEKLGGLDIEVVREGKGKPILFLHPHIGLFGSDAFIGALAKTGAVLAPSHPGYGRSALPKGMDTVDDLSYFYLDLMEQLDLRDVTVVGASLGGWIAAEMAVKSCERISRLVLIGPLGAKLGDREKADVADVFTKSRAELEALYFDRPERMKRDFAALPDEELTVIARNWESTAAYCWLPYMVNPKLRGRLHRIKAPTLVLWGANDRLAPVDYGRRYAAEIPGAKFETIADSGHFPHIEQAERTARAIVATSMSGRTA